MRIENPRKLRRLDKKLCKLQVRWYRIISFVYRIGPFIYRITTFIYVYLLIATAWRRLAYLIISHRHKKRRHRLVPRPVQPLQLKLRRICTLNSKNFKDKSTFYRLKKITISLIFINFVRFKRII